MNIVQHEHCPWGEFPAWKNDPVISHAFSTRNGGVSEGNFASLNLGRSTIDSDHHVDANRIRFLNTLGVDPGRLVLARQVHGTKVAVVSEPGVVPDCDGLLTNRKNLHLVIGVADCHVVYVTSLDRKIVGVLHAGWRGIAGGILEKAVQKIETTFGYPPAKLEVGISPAIGICCYEVGEEVAEQFNPEVVQVRNGSHYLDLSRAIVRQSDHLGIPAHLVLQTNRCTSCEPDLWFSYRRDDGVTGRMWGIIGRG